MEPRRSARGGGLTARIVPMHALPPGLLERARLRKAAADAGFDVLRDEPLVVQASSTHAPLRVWLAVAAGGYGVGLSMRNVLLALQQPEVPPALQVPEAAGWLALPDVPSLDACLSRAWQLSRTLPDELSHRFEAALQQVSATEREATVRQRVGQNLFREGLMTLWRGRCAISGLDVAPLLRASHAKPWADCASDAERLDVYNGLLLAAHLDAAFDAGLIAVADDGSVLASGELGSNARTLLGVDRPVRVVLSESHLPYMEWHRRVVFAP